MSTVATGLDYLERATEAQREATSPDRSAWVEANAGTGKTKVLTDRVSRLLLAGVQPERILCLTFTKAAAAEMRNRLSVQLGRWALADDVELNEAITRLIARPPTSEERTIARRLFARVLDAPGGINILTIHAFCQALLKRFPLEAGVAPGFDVLDDGEAETLLKQAQNAQIEALARDDAPPALRQALAAVADRVSVTEYAALLDKLLGERAWLQGQIADEAGLARERARLARILGVDPADSAEQILASACDDATFDAKLLRTAAAALLDGSESDATRGNTILRWLELAEKRSSGFDEYCRTFFRKEGGILARLATKAAQKRMPDVADVLRREAERIEAVLDRANGAALVERTMSLLRLGLDIVMRYARAKRRRGALDYDDLIVAARQLLEGTGRSAWVLYKLDGGIDHVLVDEAQDTNPDQWEVIRSLTSEFFVAGTDDERLRTMFAVGDTKQSIFGFQRADPRKLADMHTWFADRSREKQSAFRRVGLDVSFRSTEAVLHAVDWVFATPEAASGVASMEMPVAHRASRTGQPGRVELWPLVGAEKSEVDYADIAVSAGSPRAPHERLARLIAMHIGSLSGKERRAATGEPLNPGDFMVLVRRRNAFVTALVRELKRANIEVAGVDRLDLGQELAIQDLLALARFVLLPQDDLNLACLLKSPLVGLDEEALFTLAHDRDGRLWHSLRSRAGDPRFRGAHERLASWLARADFTTPFDFFARILGPEGGRIRLLERLGREAADPVDELLARALQYQRSEAGSLQGFVRWFEAGGGEIKRDLDQNRRHEVRILTVHAAKGLQAPIVYLPDTTRVPATPERLLVDDDTQARLWLPRTDDASEAARAWRKRARDKALEEQNRLLYVAMTRAEDRLYVGGWIGARKQDAGCWYDRVQAGLKASIDAEQSGRLCAVARPFDFTADLPDDGWAGDGLELVGPGEIAVRDQQELPIPEQAALPSWLRTIAPDEPDPPKPLAPSQPLPDEAAFEPHAFSPLSPDDGLRWKRGLLMHDLLHHLPGLPASARAASARRFLAQPAHGLGEEQIEQWAAEALAVTEAPAHAALFSEGSRAEVPLTGTVKTPRGAFSVSGQIDRLAVTANEVLIVDFKTNRPPPEQAEQVPLGYRRQLALYRALLQRIYPDRTIRAFLLWTALPRLMEIDAKTLDESMPYSSTP